MIAANIMTTVVHTITPGATLLDAVRLAALTHSQIPVIENGNKISGVIRWKTLLKAAFSEQKQVPMHLSSFRKSMESLNERSIEKFIDKRYLSVLPHARLTEVAAMLMDGEAAECVLVVDDHERLLGMISPGDLFKRLWEYSKK